MIIIITFIWESLTVDDDVVEAIASECCGRNVQVCVGTKFRALKPTKRSQNNWEKTKRKRHQETCNVKFYCIRGHHDLFSAFFVRFRSGQILTLDKKTFNTATRLHVCFRQQSTLHVLQSLQQFALLDKQCAVTVCVCVCVRVCVCVWMCFCWGMKGKVNRCVFVECTAGVGWRLQGTHQSISVVCSSHALMCGFSQFALGLLKTPHNQWKMLLCDWGPKARRMRRMSTNEWSKATSRSGASFLRMIRLLHMYRLREVNWGAAAFFRASTKSLLPYTRKNPNVISLSTAKIHHCHAWLHVILHNSFTDSVVSKSNVNCNLRFSLASFSLLRCNQIEKERGRDAQPHTHSPIHTYLHTNKHTHTHI